MQLVKKMRNLNRRQFVKQAFNTALLIPALSSRQLFAQTVGPKLRMGGLIGTQPPDKWIEVLKEKGYRAAYCPLNSEADETTIKAYSDTARKADIIIAEVGAWGNTISPDKNTREAAIKKCKAQLALAEKIGAKCCVNISGSKNEKYWAGPHKDNLTSDTYDMIVRTTREIIDEVKPKRTFFTLEMMPYSYPDSADAYLKLIKDIERKNFAVHFDPVNLINSPEKYYNNNIVIKECFEKLGPHIKSCHAKDILLREDVYIVQFEEVQPGQGFLDYKTYLKELSRFPDVPLMLEHLKTQDEYAQAAKYIRSIATGMNLNFD